MDNWYKAAKGKKLYIMRGISGCGKSTSARSLPGVVPENIFATDDLIGKDLDEYNAFFEQMKETDDWSPLDQKHQELIALISRAMEEGRSPLVLDNMNLSAWECKTAVQEALNKGYQVEFIDIGTGGLTAEQLAQRNSHDVPLETIKEMIEAYETEGPLTVEKVLGSEPPEEHIA